MCIEYTYCMITWGCPEFCKFIIWFLPVFLTDPGHSMNFRRNMLPNSTSLLGKVLFCLTAGELRHQETFWVCCNPQNGRSTTSVLQLFSYLCCSPHLHFTAKTEAPLCQWTWRLGSRQTAAPTLHTKPILTAGVVLTICCSFDYLVLPSICTTSCWK